CVVLSHVVCFFFFFFFFQAEDGIRDRNVTGVQTCALPIWCCKHICCVFSSYCSFWSFSISSFRNGSYCSLYCNYCLSITIFSSWKFSRIWLFKTQRIPC